MRILQTLMRDNFWKDPSFIKLLGANFFFFGGFNMLIPELPAYLEQIGGADYKGFIIGLFTLTAMLARPFSGRLTDTWGRIPVMIFGALVSTTCCFLYSLEFGLLFFFALRLVHGLSTGFAPTGITAYLDDIVPPHRRGEAIGIVGMAGTVGLAAGPSLGSFLATKFGLTTLFYASSIVSFMAFALIYYFRETLPGASAFRPTMLKIKPSEIFEKQVLAPALPFLLLSFNFGALLTIIPDYSKLLGIENKGTYFTIFTISSLLLRVLSGRLSDKYGRSSIMLVGTLVMIVAVSLLAFTFDKTYFYASAVCVGIATGFYSPVIFAWAIDLSDIRHKGRALSTIFIALEFGIGMGAFVSGKIFGNDVNNLDTTFLVCASLTSIAALLLIYFKISRHPSIR